MESFITFRNHEFHGKLQEVYWKIKEVAKKAALLHVNTIKTNNSYHFETIVKASNENIKMLRSFYTSYDKRSEEFGFLDQKELIKEAQEFLSMDLD